MKGIDVHGQPVTVLAIGVEMGFVGRVEHADERGILIIVSEGSCDHWAAHYFFPWSSVRYVRFKEE